MRFQASDEILVFVGARPGGAVGVHYARTTGPQSAHCVSNCDLPSSEHWADGFLPPPLRAEDLEIDGTLVRWRAEDGTLIERSLTAVQP
jgi:hypothetical protein